MYNIDKYIMTSYTRKMEAEDIKYVHKHKKNIEKETIKMYEDLQKYNDFNSSGKLVVNDKFYYKDGDNYIYIGTFDNMNIEIIKKYSKEIDLKNICSIHSGIFGPIKYDFVTESLENDFKIVPYKLIIHEKGDFSKHENFIPSDNMIGNIILSLSSNYEGGNLIFEDKTFKLFSKEWTFLYANCDHTVGVVESGNRITMVFNVYADSEVLLEISKSLKERCDQFIVQFDKYYNYVNTLYNSRVNIPKGMICLPVVGYCPANFEDDSNCDIYEYIYKKFCEKYQKKDEDTVDTMSIEFVVNKNDGITKYECIYDFNEDWDIFLCKDLDKIDWDIEEDHDYHCDESDTEYCLYSTNVITIITNNE